MKPHWILHSRMMRNCTHNSFLASTDISFQKNLIDNYILFDLNAKFEIILTYLLSGCAHSKIYELS